MGYCFFHTEKIHTFAAMEAKWKHNTRQYQPPNTDPDLSKFNRELIPTTKSYKQLWDEKIEELTKTGKLKRKIRSNAVLGMEVVLTLARSDSQNVDIDKWQKENMKWLEKEFNQNGTNNIVSASYHADECGSVHIHAFIVPITSDGRLCAKEFTDGPRRMRNLQDSYAEAMKQFGLERGLPGSSAKHEDIRKFYTQLNRAVYGQTPTPEKEESIEEFSARVEKFVSDLRLEHLKETKKLQREILKTQSESANHSLALLKEKEEYDRKLKKLKKLLAEKDTYAIERNLSDNEVTKRLMTISYLQNGLRNMADRDEAERLAKEINKIVKAERKREKDIEISI